MKQIIFVIVICLATLLGACGPQKKGGVIEAIEARRSIRAYKDIPVEREKLQLIAECGVKAPNAMGQQKWELRIVDSKEWIDKCTADYLKTIEGTDKANYMKVGTPEFKNIFRNAAAVIFVAAPDGLFAGEDVGCLGQNMMLAATELGLGTCFLGSAQMLLAEPGMEIYLQSLGFSNGYKLRYALAVGYPDEAPAAKERDLSKIKFVE